MREVSLVIRAVTFDFGGTLAEGELDREAYRRRLISYLRGLGYQISESSLRRVIGGMLGRLERVREKNRELRFEEVYARVLRRLGVPASEEVLDEVYSLYLQSFTSETVPGVEEVLRSLQGRYRLAVVSNAMSEIPRHVLGRSGLGDFFQAVVLSRDIGIRKPDPRIFRCALERIGVQPRDALHVGDSMEHDVVGARRAGMMTMWMRGDQEIVEEPDYVIRSLGELPRVLEGLKGRSV